MDSKEQADGEKRVRDVLIDPLLKLGLGRPTTVNKATFEEMLHELEMKLAYLSAESLEALREHVMERPEGKNKDRWPIALKILKAAVDIQAPEGDASPLLRKVFAHEMGRASIEQGWAPELLAHLKKDRRWPGHFTVSQIMAAASDARRRLEDIELRLSRGDEINPDDAKFRNHRRAALAKCQAIADLSGKGVVA